MSSFCRLFVVHDGKDVIDILEPLRSDLTDDLSKANAFDAKKEDEIDETRYIVEYYAPENTTDKQVYENAKKKYDSDLRQASQDDRH